MIPNCTTVVFYLKFSFWTFFSMQCDINIIAQKKKQYQQLWMSDSSFLSIHHTAATQGFSNAIKIIRTRKKGIFFFIFTSFENYLLLFSTRTHQNKSANIYSSAACFTATGGWSAAERGHLVVKIDQITEKFEHLPVIIRLKGLESAAVHKTTRGPGKGRKKKESKTSIVLKNIWNTKLVLEIFRLAIRKLQQIEKENWIS